MTSPNDDSDLQEGDEQMDRDAQLGAIPEYLKRHAFSEDAVLRFHDWLLPTALTWRLHATSPVKRTQREEIDRLVELMKAAAKIAAQFDFFEQISPLDQSLSDAYQALPPLVRRDVSGNWKQYRDRVHADMKILVQISETCRASLEARDPKLGAPTKGERDNLLLELYGRLERLTGKRSDLPLTLAVDVWNEYFAERAKEGTGQTESAETAKSRGELTVDAASMIRRRGRRSRDSGQKHP